MNADQYQLHCMNDTIIIVGSYSSMRRVTGIHARPIFGSRFERPSFRGVSPETRDIPIPSQIVSQLRTATPAGPGETVCAVFEGQAQGRFWQNQQGSWVTYDL